MRRRLALAVLVSLLVPAVAEGATGRTSVSAGNLRSAPGGKVVGRLPRGTSLEISCQRNGPLASGSRIWNRVVARGRSGWVGDAIVRSGIGQNLVAPYCGVPLPPAPVPGSSVGSCAIVAPVELLPPFASVAALLSAALPGARVSRDETGVPVSVTLAQSVLETGGGKVAALGNNFFGMKAQRASAGTFAWGELAVGCVLKKTWEVRSGVSAREIGAFRAYASLEDSVLDHGRRLRTNPVYSGAFRYVDRPRDFARVIARRWATDPSYATKLLRLMDQYDLAQFD